VVIAPTHDRYLFVTVASQRAKQLLRGVGDRLPEESKPVSAPRVAMEEVLRGFIPYHPGPADVSELVIRPDGETLAPAALTVTGGLSAVIRTPDAALAFQAATLGQTRSSVYRALDRQDAGFFGWRVWHEPTRSAEGDFSRSAVRHPFAVDADSDLDTLRSALGALRAAWLAEDDRARLVMTVTVAHAGEEQSISVQSEAPVLLAHPGSLILTIARKSLKPAGWFVVTFGFASGAAPSIQADAIWKDLRVRALKRSGVEVLPAIDAIDPAQLRAASELVVFVHGLFSTDIGTFDPIIDRVRFLRRTALLVGFPHNTLTDIDTNAQTLETWLKRLLGFDKDADAFERALPIVFVCHSRGGLVARATAARLFKLSRKWKALVRGAVTFGTPHAGAALAEIASEMAAAVATVAFLDKSRSVARLADILAYAKGGGSFEGLEDLRPIEGARKSNNPREPFLKTLVDKESEYGRVDILAFGGRAPTDGLVAKIVNRALGGTEHDHIVEYSSSTARVYVDEQVETHANHFGYFTGTTDNGAHHHHAARQVVTWLTPPVQGV
jgi:DNA-directed RNA polymerase subunit K/omega